MITFRSARNSFFSFFEEMAQIVQIFDKSSKSKWSFVLLLPTTCSQAYSYACKQGKHLVGRIAKCLHFSILPRQSHLLSSALCRAERRVHRHTAKSKNSNTFACRVRVPKQAGLRTLTIFVGLFCFILLACAGCSSAVVLDRNEQNLLNGARSGRAYTVKRALSRGVDVNTQDEKGITALILASYGQHIGILNYLIQQGAKLDIQDKTDRGALHYAVVTNNIKAVSLLLKAGANPNLVDRTNKTSLIYAVRLGFADIVRLLIAAKVDMDFIGDKEEVTALMLACYYGNGRIAYLLVKAGADIEIRSKKTRLTALDIAKAQRQGSIAAMMTRSLQE